MRLYSQFTLAELQTEMERLRQVREEKRKAGDMVSVGILEQKFWMVKSYLIGTDAFVVGKTYRLHGFEAPFTIDYFNGVFAWGRFEGSDEQTGYPVGMLEEL